MYQGNPLSVVIFNTLSLTPSPQGSTLCSSSQSPSAVSISCNIMQMTRVLWPTPQPPANTSLVVKGGRLAGLDGDDCEGAQVPVYLVGGFHWKAEGSSSPSQWCFHPLHQEPSPFSGLQCPGHQPPCLSQIKHRHQTPAHADSSGQCSIDKASEAALILSWGVSLSVLASPDAGVPHHLGREGA